MQPLRLLSAVEQVASHLRAEIEMGHWTASMPGVNRLAMELGVNRKTVEAALKQLEYEGLLVGQGAGRRRLIVLREGNPAGRRLRVGILLPEPSDLHTEYIVELQHALVEAGHDAIFPSRFLTELKMEVGRVSRLVEQTAVDAWVVGAAAREVLEWFSAQPGPSFALFGPHMGLPMAGTRPDKPRAYSAATRHLIEHGHQRIVLLTRRLGGPPEPRQSERAFLAELEASGVKTGEFNLPNWKETREGLQEILTSLFHVTPPTAMIIDEAPLFAATQQFLAGRGIRVPQQVSLICTDPDPTFLWCVPSVAHIRWDSRSVVRRIVRWAANASKGREDVQQSIVEAEFVPGGTVATVPSF
jgi:DNA-binding LacI/PurR family transcriptional regulator